MQNYTRYPIITTLEKKYFLPIMDIARDQTPKKYIKYLNSNHDFEKQIIKKNN